VNKCFQFLLILYESLQYQTQPAEICFGIGINDNAAFYDFNLACEAVMNWESTIPVMFAIDMERRL